MRKWSNSSLKLNTVTFSNPKKDLPTLPTLKIFGKSDTFAYSRGCQCNRRLLYKGRLEKREVFARKSGAEKSRDFTCACVECGRNRKTKESGADRLSDHKVPFAPKPQRQRGNHAPEKEKNCLIEFFVRKGGPPHLAPL